MRGGLVGAIPEALCGEAPKGQPVIRSEHLVTVSVDDPKGHPMIHGCRRPHKPRPSGRQKGRRKEKWPIVVTVDRSGKEITWGPLTRTAAWKAGCYWEETKGDAKVFLVKGAEKKEMSVEKLIGEDGPRFWFKDKPEPPEQQVEERQDEQSVTEEEADETTTEEAIQVMSEIDPDEKERGRKCGWLRR